jgi:hypothetical protein
MSMTDQVLIETLKSLPAQQRAEVEDFVEFLAAKTKKRAAWDRLLAIAPALQAAGVEPMSEEEVAAEIKAARAERRTRMQAAEPGADRS